MKNRRKFPRVDVFSHGSNICIGKNRNIIGQNIGVVLNVSQNSVILQTSSSVASNFIAQMTMDFYYK